MRAAGTVRSVTRCHLVTHTSGSRVGRVIIGVSVSVCSSVGALKGPRLEQSTDIGHGSHSACVGLSPAEVKRSQFRIGMAAGLGLHVDTAALVASVVVVVVAGVVARFPRDHRAAVLGRRVMLGQVHELVAWRHLVPALDAVAVLDVVL